ncbi:hypothetical protein Enr10x_45430 [Gimesia panareensis]|uniref:Uncharacterized protein n=1 Tax=Gimesia panareensis TaxID=2527978 RepID=A0A518ABE5_9PLAN|nr:hypothetical protein Enr10x_45430 [Gimesia panareensis]QDU52046.1 hypothetical protein Pan110_44160 [Gimesia panareensis]
MRSLRFSTKPIRVQILRSLPCVIFWCSVFCCAGVGFADEESIFIEQSEIGKTFSDVDDSSLQVDPVRGLYFSPCCGTLFQWNAGPECSGGPQLDQPLQTDRPNFTSTSVTVGKGVTQIESGYTYMKSNETGQDVRYQSFGEFLFRQGILADWLEFRVGFSPLQQTAQIGSYQNSTFGTDDLDLALQFALTPQAGILPEMALIVSMSVPTGSPAFTSHQVEPGVDLIYAWQLNDFLSVAASTQGYGNVDDSGSSYLEMAQSCSVGYQLTKSLGAYTEWFALIPSGARTARTEHYFDAGFTYLINNNVQLDMSAGVGLSEAAADFFAGAGLSIRFP